MGSFELDNFVWKNRGLDVFRALRELDYLFACLFLFVD